MAKDYDHLFKLVIIGDSGVGKSCLLLRFADNTFSESYINTIGVDCKAQTVDIDGERVKLQIWDTAGQERFRAMAQSYYRGSHGVILVYNVQSAQSFVNVRRWLHEIEDNCSTVDQILVGNKNDDPDKKVVESDDAKILAKDLSMSFFETSAKENINVHEMFTEIARQILRTKKSSQQEADDGKVDGKRIKLSGKGRRRKKKDGCC